MRRDLFSLDGKIALVTGAGTGLGERFARVLAEFGAKVVLVGRRQEQIDRVAAAIKEEGGEALAVAADVTDRASMESAFDTAEQHFGVVDVLINNAGVQAEADFLDMEESTFTSVMDINVTGLWRTAQIAARRMVEGGKTGSIVNVASIMGLTAKPGHVNYCGSKAAVLHMTRTMALELAIKGIRVNALAPGYIETDLTRWYLESEEGKAAQSRMPISRFGLLEELDGPLLLLASDASTYMYGATLAVDGAHSRRIIE